jgi:hypothetical protein
MTEYKIGDRIKPKVDIIETACGDHPAFLYAKAGDLLIVRKIRRPGDLFDVSHEDRTDNSFIVSFWEIEPYE